MKNYILLLIIPILSFGQDDYVPQSQRSNDGIEYVRYCENGKILLKGILKDEKEEGLWLHRTGMFGDRCDCVKPNEINYKNGKLHGVEKEYDCKKGYLLRETNYVDGQLDNIKEYYENEQLKEETYYENGEEKSTCEWNYYGTIKCCTWFNNENSTSYMKCYDEKGNEIDPDKTTGFY